MLILLFFIWVILNGKATAEILLIGAVLAFAVYLFACKYMGYSVRRDMQALRKAFAAAGYAVTLVVEIIIANFAVIRLILFPKSCEPKPLYAAFRTDLRSDTMRVILANSITLTPGTITVTLEDDTYTVHCLDESLFEGIESSRFVRRLKKMEALGGAPLQKR